jgi:hypothetical protein
MPSDENKHVGRIEIWATYIPYRGVTSIQWRTPRALEATHVDGEITMAQALAVLAARFTLGEDRVAD